MLNLKGSRDYNKSKETVASSSQLEIVLYVTTMHQPALGTTVYQESFTKENVH